MGRLNSTTLVGVLLVLGGVFFLTQTLGLVAITAVAAWAVIFTVVGVAFLASVLVDRGIWWPLIPGFAFLGIGLVLAIRSFAPGVPGSWAGSIFLGLLGVAFVAVYLMRSSNWWAIIPGGTLLTLAVVAAIDSGARRGEGGALFLIGLGVTFLLVYLAPTQHGRMTWALFPAGMLLVLGFVSGVGSTVWFGAVWPILLIAAGTYLVYRAYSR